MWKQHNVCSLCNYYLLYTCHRCTSKKTYKQPKPQSVPKCFSYWDKLVKCLQWRQWIGIPSLDLVSFSGAQLAASVSADKKTTGFSVEGCYFEANCVLKAFFFCVRDFFCQVSLYIFFYNRPLSYLFPHWPSLLLLFLWVSHVSPASSALACESVAPAHGPGPLYQFITDQRSKGLFLDPYSIIQ